MISTKISSGNHMISTAFNEVYDKFATKEGSEKLFERKHELFSFALVYGILYDKKLDKTPKTDMVRIAQVEDEATLNTIDIAAYLLDDGKKDEKDIWKEILLYADGGLEKLNEIYEKNKSFTIPILIAESQKLWSDRAKKLHNINLS